MKKVSRPCWRGMIVSGAMSSPAAFIMTVVMSPLSPFLGWFYGVEFAWDRVWHRFNEHRSAVVDVGAMGRFLA